MEKGISNGMLSGKGMQKHYWRKINNAKRRYRALKGSGILQQQPSAAGKIVVVPPKSANMP